MYVINEKENVTKMRLWTIQNKSILDAVSKSVWYSNLGYRNKDIDTDVDLSLRGRFPIYTYAMLSHDYLNINTLRVSLKEILQQQRLPRSWDDVLVELEVPEDEIVHIKPVESKDYESGFQCACNYKEFITDIIISCKKGESAFGTPKNLEAVLHRVLGNEIVAAHELSVDPVNDVITFNTVYKNENVGAPALSRSISLNTDGTFRIDRNKDADLVGVKNSYKDANTLVKAYCSAEFPNDDMTVFEAINFVKSDKSIDIIRNYDAYEILHPDATMYNTYIRDIRPVEAYTAEV